MPQTIYAVNGAGYSGQRGHYATTTVHSLNVAGGGTQDIRVTITSDDPDEIEFASYGSSYPEDAFIRPGRDFWTGTGDTTDEEYTFAFTEEPSGDPAYLDSFSFDFREFGDYTTGSQGALATEAFYIDVDRGDGNGYQRLTFQDPNEGSIQWTVLNGNPAQFSVDTNGVFAADGAGVTSGSLEAEGTVTIEGPLVGFRMQYIETNPSGFTSYSYTDGFEIPSAMEAGDVVCIAGEMPVHTPQGPLPVQTLEAGDPVSTRRGPMPIRWVGRAHVAARGKQAPVRITAGALGPDMPSRDVLLSRQHRVLLQTPALKDATGHAAAFVSAIHLTDLPGIFVDDAFDTITYVQILLTSHQIVTIHNLPCETFYLGKMAVQALSVSAQAELHEIHPDLTTPPFPLAYPVLRGKAWRSVLAKLKTPALH